MKNFMRLTALVLCLMLAFPTALAQEYVLGEPTMQAFVDAFMAGQVVMVDVEMDIELNEAALGITAAEEVELAEALEDLICQSKLTIGAGAADGAVRFVLGAQMTDEANANPVEVTALMDVTLDGVSIESDLIPGKRINVKWETLLEMAGMSQSDIEMLMLVKEIDPEMTEQVLAELSAEIEPMLEMAVQMVLPYFETVGNFVQTLPVEVRENLVEEDYPVTAKEVSVTITEKDLGTLVTLLCDQLEQDSVMTVLLNSALEEGDAGVTVQELIAEFRKSAAQMTDTTQPLTFYLGMNEEGLPLYVEAICEDTETNEQIYGGLFLYEDTDGTWILQAIFGLLDAEGEVTDALYAGGTYAVDPEDKNIHQVYGEFYAVIDGESVVQMTFSDICNKSEESELPAYGSEVGLDIAYVENGETISVSQVTYTMQEMTAAGGEMISTSTTVFGPGEDEEMTYTVERLVEPTAGFGVSGYGKGSYGAGVVEGVDQLDMLLTFRSEAIDMGASLALEQIALEEMTQEQIDALSNDVIGTATTKVLILMANLPEVLLNMIVAEMM